MRQLLYTKGNTVKVAFFIVSLFRVDMKNNDMGYGIRILWYWKGRNVSQILIIGKWSSDNCTADQIVDWISLDVTAKNSLDAKLQLQKIPAVDCASLREATSVTLGYNVHVVQLLQQQLWWVI